MSVLFQEDVETGVHLDPAIKEVQYNPTYDTMFAPEVRNNIDLQSRNAFGLKSRDSINFVRNSYKMFLDA